jgi:hypothetical protein
MSSNNIYSSNLKEIPGYPGYFLNENFEVIGKTGKLLSQCGEKHKFVNVRQGGKSTILYVHRAVALVHVAGYFEGAWCDHIDNNPMNNKPDNLRWVTPQQNNFVNKNLTRNIILLRIKKLEEKIEVLKKLL